MYLLSVHISIRTYIHIYVDVTQFNIPILLLSGGLGGCERERGRGREERRKKLEVIVIIVIIVIIIIMIIKKALVPSSGLCLYT